MSSIDKKSYIILCSLILIYTHCMGNLLKQVNPFPNKPWFFTCLQYKSFENSVGKGDIAHDEQCLLFPQCFLPFWRTFCHFHQLKKIVVCKLLQAGGVKNLSFGKGLRVNFDFSVRILHLKKIWLPTYRE